MLTHHLFILNQHEVILDELTHKMPNEYVIYILYNLTINKYSELTSEQGMVQISELQEIIFELIPNLIKHIFNIFLQEWNIKVYECTSLWESSIYVKPLFTIYEQMSYKINQAILTYEKPEVNFLLRRNNNEVALNLNLLDKIFDSIKLKENTIKLMHCAAKINETIKISSSSSTNLPMNTQSIMPDESVEHLYYQICLKAKHYYYHRLEMIQKDSLCLIKQFYLNEEHLRANEEHLRANEEYLRANEEYLRANEEYLQANEEYLQANEGYLQANEGYLQAFINSLSLKQKFFLKTDIKESNNIEICKQQIQKTEHSQKLILDRIQRNDQAIADLQNILIDIEKKIQMLTVICNSIVHTSLKLSFFPTTASISSSNSATKNHFNSEQFVSNTPE